MSQLESSIQPAFAINQFDEAYLPSINRNTFDNIDSVSLFDQKFKALFQRENQLNIIIGLDSGLLVNYVLKSPIAKDSYFIFVELDEVLALLNCDIDEQYKERIIICNPAQFDELINEPQYALYLGKKQFRLHYSTACHYFHHPQYNHIRTHIECLLFDRFQEQAQYQKSIDFITTQVTIAPDNLVPATCLKHQFKGQTAIILAGGPSLDQHIDWIKQHREQFVVIAVSRLGQRLQQAELTPDIFVSVDPYDVSYTVSAEANYFAEQAILVNSYHVSPLLLGQWPGKNLYLGPRLPVYAHPQTEDDKNNIPMHGPTVTNSALALACHMGFSRIIFSGMDMCHSKEGFSHASGSIEHSVGPNLGNIYRWVTTYSGEQAETPINLLSAIESLALDIEHYADIEFINLNPHAAVVKGIKHLSCKQISLTKPSLNLSNKVHELVEQAYQLDRPALLATTIAEFTQLKNDCRAIKDLAQQALSLCLQSTKLALDSTQRNKKQYQIEKLEKKITKNKLLTQFIRTFGYEHFHRFLTTQQKQNWLQQDIDNRTQLYYQAIIDSCNSIIALYQASIERCHNRIHEANDTSNLMTLAEQWRKDNQELRYQAWLTRHNYQLAQLSDDSQQLINQLQQEHAQIQQQRSHSFNSTWKNFNVLDKIQSKVMHFVSNKQLTELAFFNQQLQSAKAKDSSLNRVAVLCQSYLYFLNGEDQQANQTLQQLPQEQYTEAEYKLLSLVALNLANMDVAQTALLQLSHYSDSYKPQYAHLLKLNGQYQQALHIYLEYLEKYEADTVTWLKLGQFFIEVEQLASALDCFNKVLQLDPNNIMANKYVQLATPHMP